MENQAKHVKFDVVIKSESFGIRIFKACCQLCFLLVSAEDERGQEIQKAQRARAVERGRGNLRTISFTHQCKSALASTKARHYCNCSVTPRYIETIEQILPRAQEALDCISPRAVKD